MAPGAGAFVVATSDGEPVACGGVQALEPGVGEIKRMWVHPGWRGAGLGSRLLRHLEQVAAELGHTTVRLDTNGTLVEAIAMYERAGYRHIERYNDNPYAQAWFEKSLTPGEREQERDDGDRPQQSHRHGGVRGVAQCGRAVVRCWFTLLIPRGSRSRRSGTGTTLGREPLPVQLDRQQPGLGPGLELVEVVRRPRVADGAHRHHPAAVARGRRGPTRSARPSRGSTRR